MTRTISRLLGSFVFFYAHAFAATAVFQPLDTTTQGNWKGIYGQDGRVIVNDSTVLPAYATLTTTAPTWTWWPSSVDPRALLKGASATDRIASAYNSGSSFTLDVNLTDGQPHQIALYCLDLDTTARNQKITVIDAATNAALDVRTISNFHNGVYAIWNVQGHVLFQVTNQGGLNAVVSGVFFRTFVSGPPPTVSLTSPAAGTVSGQVALSANASSGVGLASVQFQLDGANLGAPVGGTGPSFSSQWSSTSAANGTHVLTAVATDSQGQQGTSTPVSVTVSNAGPPPPAATFVKLDTTTKGTWKGVYGQDGYVIPNLTPDIAKFPSYLTSVPRTGGSAYNYPGASNTDPRSLQKGESATDRIASVFYSNPTTTPFSFDLNMTDGQPHQVALYVWDLDTNARAETISILNAADNTVLDSRAMSALNGGVWAIWNLQGHVIVKVTFTGGQNAVLNGLFFGPVGVAVPPPTVSMTSPAAGAVSGTVTLTANATATAGIASVQFQLDGANLGAPVTTGGPTYSMQWASSTASNGSHTVRAIATDTQAQSTTSAGVTVTVGSGSVPTVSITAPAPGAVSGTVAVTANATSTVTMASVQFQLDGANLGAAVSGVGPLYSIQWNSAAATPGSHVLTAIATDTAAHNATSAGVTVTVPGSGTAPTATFVRTDTTTKGTWKGAYGQDGYLIPTGGTDITKFPAYLSSMPRTGGAVYTYANLNADVRAPQKPDPATDRTASVVYTSPSATPFSFDVNLTDGQAHQLAMYCVDFDSNARLQTVSILNAADNTVLDSRPISAMNGGVWLVWNLQGHVIIKVTSTSSGNNAVTSGLFFAPVGSAAAAPTVSMTSPNAGTVSGAVGLAANATSTAGVASVQFQLDGANLGAPVTGSGPSYTMQWASNTVADGVHTLRAVATDTQAQSTTSASVTVTVSNNALLPTVSITAPAPGAVTGSVSVTANASSTVGMASVQFQLDGANLGAAVTGSGPTYTTSWNTATATNGSHTLTAIATDTGAHSATSAGVTVTVSAPGTAPAATFVRTDSTTKGTWKGVYGQDGYLIPTGTTDLTKFPAYLAALPRTSGAVYNYPSFNSDVRAPQKPDPATDRTASLIYSNPTGTAFSFDVNLTDGLAHQLAVYCVDFDTSTRAQTISILNANDNTVLDSRPISVFNGGLWAIWNVQGHVIIKVAYTAGQNAVISGLYFGPVGAAAPPPTVSMTSPSAGSVSGSVTLTANATSTVGIASVQFQLDGANLGAPVTGSGPNYSMSWASNTASNGSHTLRAIATDTQAQSATSSGVAVTVTGSGALPTVSITAPASGAVSGTVTVTANATSTAGMASVQFQLDGANLGAAVAGSGPTYSTSWNSATASNGSHTLTAIATDTAAHSATSAGVTVNASNTGTAASATFVNTDTTTKGTWKGTYGQDGYVIPTGAADITKFPGYLTSLPRTQGSSYNYPGYNADLRAPQKPDPATDRTGSVVYSNPSSTPFSFDMNLSDGQAHQVAVYCVDYDSNARAQSISILDAVTNAVLDTRQVSAFNGGAWVVWSLKGHVIIKVATTNSGNNAVISGIFLGANAPPPPAPTVSMTSPAAGPVANTVTLTANATSTVGVASVQFRLDGANLGAPVTVGGPNYSTTWNTLTAGNGSHSLTAIATDTVGQTTPSAGVTVSVSNSGPAPTVSITAPAPGNVSGNVAITANTTTTLAIASVQFKLGGTNLGPPVTGAGPTFSMTWNTFASGNGPFSLTALVTDSIGQTGTSSAVQVTVANVGPPAPSGQIVNLDRTTAGSWKGLYGQEGYIIPNTPNDFSATPSWATITGTGSTHYVYSGFASTTYAYGLLKPDPATDRIVSVFPTNGGAGTSMSWDVNISDSLTHQVALYCLDFDTNARAQTIQVLNANTNAVLATTSIANYHTGVWAVYNIAGHVILKVTSTGAGNGVVSGLFFGPATPPPPLPTVSVTSPAAGSVSGLVTLSANATSTIGVASVQFQLDGTTNVGPVLTGAGPLFTMQWNSTTTTNGAHTLTAIVTDLLGQTVPSASVAILVGNGPPPTVSVTAPAPGAVLGQVALSATASSTVGLASVQFQVDGANLGSAVQGAGPTFQAQWDSTKIANGAHSVTAIATDTFGQHATSAAVAVTVTNPAPVISITAPAAGPVAGTVTITANATSASGIASVQFKLDNANIGAAVIAGGPNYSFQWSSSTALNGSRTLTAVATDLLGQQKTSAPVTVTVSNPPPTVSITNPANASTVGGAVTINANATSAIGVASLQFAVDGVALGTAISGAGPNFSKQWQTTPAMNGPHTLTATATDLQGQTSSGSVTVTVSTVAAPTVNITGPSGGVQGTVSVTALATSSIGMASVQFQLDGANLGAVVNGAGPYAVSWDTTKSQNGSHALTAIATDTLNQAATSPVATVTVANPPPTVSITAPAGGATVTGTNVTLTATAASGVGLASLQFKLEDGSTLATVPGAGPTFSTSWNSTGTLNGSHTLTAVATDAQGQAGTSAGVSITVHNTAVATPKAIYVQSAAGILGAGTTACPAGGTPRPIYAHSNGSFIGSWKAPFGTLDGQSLAPGFTGGTGYVTTNISGGNGFTYTDSSCELTDSRAMEAVTAGQDRVFAVYYSASQFQVDLDINDGRSHLMAVYAFDPEPNAHRTEILEIADAFGNVLDSRPISNFYGGIYVVWNVQGHIVLKVKNTNPGQNAVISGVFFRSFSGNAPLVSVTSPSANASVQKAVPVIASATTTSPSGIGSVRFQLDGADLNSPVNAAGSTFTAQWVTPTVANGAHTLTAIAVDGLLQASVSPGVQVTVNNGPAPAASATFVGSDAATQGNWKVKYGAEGYVLPCNSLQVNCPNGLTVNPFYAAVDTKGALQYTYGLGPAGSTSPKVLYTPNSTQQNESVFYQLFDKNLNTCAVGTSAGCNVPILLDINLQDYGQHQLSLYFLDHGSSQHQTVTILDANNPSTVLSTQNVTFPMTGFYLTWTLQGHVLVQISETGGPTDASNSVILSGVFFQPAQ
ncbi:MAG: Ig-like domain-containing protein [Candidatus Solibacter sp.]